MIKEKWYLKKAMSKLLIIGKKNSGNGHEMIVKYQLKIVICNDIKSLFTIKTALKQLVNTVEKQL